MNRITCLIVLSMFVILSAATRAAELPIAIRGTALFVASEKGFAIHDATGTASYLGPWSGAALVKGGLGHSQAFISLHGADGNSLEIFVLQRLNRDTGNFEGTFWICGGTGEFSGATGIGDFEAVSIPDGAELYFDGTIDY